MTPISSTCHRQSEAMLSSVSTPSLAVEENHKRPTSLRELPVSKKRRCLVTRTHSPKREESPLSVAFRRQPETTARNPHHGSQTQWYDVRKLSPTVKGVTEAVRLMHTGETVVIPTESVYMACTSIVFDEGTSKSFPDSFSGIRTNPELRPILLVKRPVASLERVLSFPKKPYAIKEKDGKSSLPVAFSERKEVLKRIAKKFWPGPLIVYMNSKVECPSLPLHSFHGDTYIGVSNSSHPLTNRLVKEASSDDRFIVAMPTFRSSAGSPIHYMTKADEVCSHYSTQISTEKQTVHVLNGEDKREPFSVPTCHYGKPLAYSLWINDSVRTIFIRGMTPIPTDDSTKATVIRAMLSSSDDAAQTVTPANAKVAPSADLDKTRQEEESDRLRNRNRVMAAVLRQWKVVELRSMTTLSAQSSVNSTTASSASSRT